MDMGMDNVDEQADEVYSGILGEIGLEYLESDPVRFLFQFNRCTESCKRSN